MKKIFFSIIACGAFTINSIAQLPNPGFETWTNMGAYENPDGWATLNEYTTGSGIYTVTKGTPGSPGSSYLKLTSQTIGPAVVNGIAVSGTINPTTQQAESGFAFNQQPVSFNGKWQHMIYGTSQGSINVTLTRWDAGSNSRIVVANANKTLTGMAMSWSNFSIPFVYVDGQAPDSCIIVMKASGSNPTQNDYLWVDNLSFVGSVAGINEVSSVFSEITIFPNPAVDFTKIQINSKESLAGSISIVNLAGAVIKKEDISINTGLNEFVFDLTSLDSGSYLIQIDSDENISVLPFVVR